MASVGEQGQRVRQDSIERFRSDIGEVEGNPDCKRAPEA